MSVERIVWNPEEKVFVKLSNLEKVDVTPLGTKKWIRDGFYNENNIELYAPKEDKVYYEIGPIFDSCRFSVQYYKI